MAEANRNPKTREDATEVDGFVAFSQRIDVGR